MKIGVIGLGYVGLTAAVGLATQGHDIVGIDTNQVLINALKNGRVPLYEPDIEHHLQVVLSQNRIQMATNAQPLRDCDVIFICAGTGQEVVDLSSVQQVCVELANQFQKANQRPLIVIKSTVPPGTTRHLWHNTLQGFSVCMNPEFLREGVAMRDFLQPDRIVLGVHDDDTSHIMREIYTDFNCPIIETTLENAEMVKYASNALLSTLISFSNDIAALCEATPNTDAHDIMDMLHLDHRLSPIVDGLRLSPGILSYLRAGVGFGGSCLPKDLLGLLDLAQHTGHDLPTITGANATNGQRPAQIVALLERNLGNLTGKTIAVMGIAFKPDTDDIRKSPSIPIIENLIAKNAWVRLHDPVALEKAASIFHDQITYHPTPETLLKDADAAIICTAWSLYRGWGGAFSTMKNPLVVDGRGLLRDITLPSDVQYIPIGKYLGTAL